MKNKKQIFHAGLVGLVFVVAFSFGATPIRTSNDVWWHLKTGQLISGSGIPEIDPFNHIVEERGTTWHNHEWLGQLGMWLAYRAGEKSGVGGIRMLILCKAILIGLTFALLALFAGRLAGGLLPGVIAAIIGAEIARRTFYPRPPIYGYLFLVVLYGVLHGVRVERISWKWFLLGVLPGFAVWSNFHGSWMAGLVLIGAFGAGASMEAASKYYRTAPLTDYFARVIRAGIPWVFAGVLAVIGSVLNPSTWHLYEVFSRVMGDKFLVSAIGELQPPDVSISTFFWLVIIGLVVLAAAVPKRFPHAAEYLFVPFFLWQAIHHWRHLSLFGIVAAPFLAWFIAEGFRSLPMGIAGIGRLLSVVVLVLLSVYFVFLNDENGTYYQRNGQLFSGVAYYPENFPEKECDFILRAKLPGKLFNLDYYAGYLIWRLSPIPYQVYSDSRFDIFGSDIAREANRIIACEPGWEEILEERGVNLVLIPTGKVLAVELGKSDEWSCVYYRLRRSRVRGTDKLDWNPYEGWVLFARRTDESAGKIEAAEDMFRRSRPRGLPDLFGYR